jgi:hypothetical protein
MAAKPTPTLTITVERDNGEKIEIKEQPVDIFADHPSFAPPFYSAIGKLVIQSGHLETQLSMVVDLCRKLEMERLVKKRHAVLVGQQIAAIREALESGRLFGEPSADPMWSAILAAAMVISTKRNQIIHGFVLGFEEGPPARIRVSYRGAESAYTLQELQDIISNMQEVHLLLGGLNAILTMDHVRRFHLAGGAGNGPQNKAI